MPTTKDHPLSQYYQFQSRIYDLTRWSFLFGRKHLLANLPFRPTEPLQILEVGCGTGHNLLRLAKKYPEAEITGIDLSADMLAKAGKKVTHFGDRIQLLNGAFGDADLGNSFDLIIFSYCLTMVNPGWEALVRAAHRRLLPQGLIAVVDFHDSSIPIFERHMGGHHVRMEGHLLPLLSEKCREENCRIRSAYGGIWRWFEFIGRK
ncbi:MAG: methyltransferase domain-containing protein [Bacteroidota bacterium]